MGENFCLKRFDHWIYSLMQVIYIVWLWSWVFITYGLYIGYALIQQGFAATHTPACVFSLDFYIQPYQSVWIGEKVPDLPLEVDTQLSLVDISVILLPLVALIP